MTQDHFSTIPINTTPEQPPAPEQPPPSPPPRRLSSIIYSFIKRLILLLTLLGMGAATAIGVGYWALLQPEYLNLTTSIDTILDQRYHQLRAGAFEIRQGDDLLAMQLLDRLHELGYRRSAGPNGGAGTYYLEGNQLYLQTIPETMLSSSYQLTLQGPVLQSITTDDNVSLNKLHFPSLLLTSYLDSIWEIRTHVPYNKIPPQLIRAVLATEDQHYLHHPGVDPLGIIRAVIINVQAGRVVQGGSTITQQLVKVLRKNDERSLNRKLSEAVLALALERRYTKEELLESYLNNIYLGQATPFQIRGIAAAAEYILGKDLADLNLEECALLAGMIRSPNSVSPLRNPRRAAIRTRTVLSQMAALGEPEAADILIGDELVRFRHESLLPRQGWYFDQLARELKRLGLDQPTVGNQLIIESPLDPWFQLAATEEISRHCDDLNSRHESSRKSRSAEERIEGALVMLDHATGGIKALVGGSDYRNRPFNRASLIKRQIGSLIKPFVYLTALGGTSISGMVTQADRILDSPVTIRYSTTVWTPRNYDKKYAGRILLRDALVQSRNIPAVKLGELVGLENVRNLVEAVAITDQAPPYPSLFLGAVESSPLRMAVAYAALANGGYWVEPQLISAIYQNGQLVRPPIPPRVLLAPAPCAVLTDMLQEVMVSGTARSSRRLGFSLPAAGKTGTTNDNHDSWFAGYTPDLTAVVWIGRDDNKPCGYTGASGALPVWARLFASLLGSSAPHNFTLPPGVSYLDINPATGEPATDPGSHAVPMVFITGSEPRQLDDSATPSVQPEQISLKPEKRKVHYKVAGTPTRPPQVPQTHPTQQLKKLQQRQPHQKPADDWLASRLATLRKWLGSY